ncbi:MAG: hypothetical protein A2V91_05250 [Candidatus Muproteobacteria bacterium RBG_16_64_10]|uniref:Putative DNA-binding domain-containing protein n=1 Tax=Candidatus Muproteobacteria bacterium RBG_16_64_10 TaxID=1817757 RepID=A0A1F6T1F8_9PROT|nr:MAG: hypothetical protein A2V91_05250 [Candidatus Muproteobacteria bacterium RBG_16_64_10]
MNRLRHTQSDFQDYLLRREGPMAGQIAGSEQVDAQARLEIYANAYRLRLLEALDGDFVALRAQVGPERFEKIGRAYIDARPSDHFSLRYYGRHMAHFLAETEPYRDEPLLAELATFDWALTVAFDSADSPVATVGDMACIAPDNWPRLTFVPHASVQRLNLAWNAPVIWKAADKDESLPAPKEAEFPVGWVVWRQDLQIYFRSLAVDEAFALDALLRGETFGALCEGLTEWIDAQNVAVHAAGLLKQWLTDGLIKEIKIE